VLIDTDVLIWMTRGHADAAAKLQTITPWRISAVTYMELAQGCRNKEELTRIKNGLALCHTEIVPVSAAISDRAMQLIDADRCQASCRFYRDGRRFLSQAVLFSFCGFKSTHSTRCQFRVSPDQRVGFLALAA
jgi:uncharacterized protein with PIN domain